MSTLAADPPLPDVFRGELDPAGLGRLFSDLAGFATLDEVRVKGPPGRRCMEDTPTLGDALARLLSGDVRGVQVRYTFEGRGWCDTVLVLSAGRYALTRLRAPV